MKMDNYDMAINVLTNYDSGLTKVKKDGDMLVGTFKKIEAVNGKLFSSTKQVKIGFDELGQAFTGEKFISATKFNMSAIRGELMGIGFAALFGGMALKRFFSNIATAGVQSFKKIIETTNNNSTALQQLTVHWESLKFAVGSAINRALEPLLPYLIKIISWASELIQKNPEKVFYGLITAITLFTAFIIGGQFTLAASAILGLFEKLAGLKMIDISTKLAGFGALADKINSFISKYADKLLTIPIAAILIIDAAVELKDRMFNIQHFTVFDALETAFKAGLGASLVAFILGAGMLLITLVGVATFLITLTPQFIRKGSAEKDLKATMETMGGEQGFVEALARIDLHVESLKSAGAPYEEIIRVQTQYNDMLEMGKFGIEQLSEKVNLMKGTLNNQIEPLSNAAQGVDNLSRAFGVGGEGLNTAIKTAVEESLPQLNTSLSELTETLKLQEEQFYNTSESIMVYNRSLEGATE